MSHELPCLTNSHVSREGDMVWEYGKGDMIWEYGEGDKTR